MAVKNSFGSSITLTLFGESHGLAVGAVLDGLCPGMPVDEETIAALLSRRRPSSGTAGAGRFPAGERRMAGQNHGDASVHPDPQPGAAQRRLFGAARQGSARSRGLRRLLQVSWL